MNPVISSTQGITAEWLNAVLGDAGKLRTRILDVSIDPIGAGVGLMGELARVSLTYEGDEDLPQTMVVKCAAQNENKEVAKLLDFYQREVNFYNNVGAASGLRVPHCYHGAYSPENNDFVLLLEDMGDVSPRDQLIGAGEAETGWAIDKLAVMHSRYWGASPTQADNWMYEFMSGEEAAKLKNYVYLPGLEPCIEKFSDHFNTATRDLVKEVGHRYEDIWANWASPQMTFIHGDYRQDNFIYPTSGPDAIVMDWQISGLGRGIFDVAYFLCQSVQPDLREKLEMDLLRRYVDGLKAGGVEGYDFDQALHDYRVMILGCLVYPVTVCGTLDLANERGRALAACMLDRNLKAVETLGCAELL